MGAGLGEGDTVPGVRQLAGADGAGVGFGINRINCQRHCYDGVATSGSLQRSSLSTSFGEGNTVPCVGQLAGANSHGIGCFKSCYYRQDHGHHRVAAIHSWQRGNLGTRFCKGDAIPSVGQQAGTDGHGVGNTISREGR